MKGKTVKFDAKATSDVNVTVKRVEVLSAGTHQSREAINVLFGDSHVQQMEWNKYIENSTELGKQRWDPMYETGAAPAP